ncbi:hypothetical protein EVG20_g9987 [Dentipellis fragilis]|uniref:Uncharacterized protein n=1 Tax=Dentipellis fragilis TaxID=205917 RepID=A0A4Y9XVD5_9AGAM|nr:hypothetical protein EVG20_g9987 [Dentipellis fragilis]
MSAPRVPARILPDPNANGRRTHTSKSTAIRSRHPFPPSAAHESIPHRPLRSSSPERGRSRSPLHSSRSHSPNDIVDGMGRKHVRSEAEDVEEGDEARRKRYVSGFPGENITHNDVALFDEKYWEAKGKILGRCVEMWDSFNLILDEGISRDPENDISELRTTMQNECYRLFRQLLDVAPAMVSVLEAAGDNLGAVLTKQLHDVIDRGRKAARREDVNGIKEEIGKWSRIQWEPAFPSERHLLGFYHETTGSLLAPVGENWNDQRVRDKYRAGLIKVGPDDYPAFLWPRGLYDPDNMMKDVLRGELIELGYLHIFICPTAAKNGSRSTCPGNAALHDIAFVTYESICYVATIVRYALSDEQRFSPGNSKDPKSFPYRDFYRELLDLRHHMTQEEVDGLLTWWNEKIFPASVYTPRKKNPNSIAAKMRAQAKEKRIACEKEAAERAREARRISEGVTTATPVTEEPAAAVAPAAQAAAAPVTRRSTRSR